MPSSRRVSRTSPVFRTGAEGGRPWFRSVAFAAWVRVCHGRAGRLVAFAAAVVLAVTLLESWTPREAAASPRPDVEAPAAPQAPAGPLERGDEASARIAARVSGKRVEVTSLRSERVQVFAEPSGVMTMSSFARPVRVRRPDGSWTPVNLDLQAVGDGRLAPKAATAQVRISGGGTGPFASVGDGTRSVGLSWPSPLPAPTVEGPTATYPDVLPGVDLKVTADTEGFSEVLVVKTRAAGASAALAQLRLPVSSTGVTVSLDAGKNLRATDPQGNVVFAGSAPTMWDSSTTSDADGGSGEPGRVAPVGASLVGGALALVPDAVMLTSPSTQYPVFIDPSARLNTLAWTYFDSGFPSTSYYNSADAAKVGTYNAGANVLRSAFALPTETLRGKHILDADFNAYLAYSWSCTASMVDLYKITPFSPSSTWSSMPTFLSPKINAWTGAGGYSSACPGQTVRFDITPTVQAGANANDTRLWLALRANSETSNLGWKKFSNNPNMDVTYNTIPAGPTGFTVVPCYAVCVTPVTTGTLRPTLRAKSVDSDGGASLTMNFEVRDGATVVASGSSAAVSSGVLASWQVPTNLTAGTTYTARVRAFDGVDYGPWSGNVNFVPDVTKPAAATVASTDYPNGSWSKGAGQAGSFTFGPGGSTDVHAYYYALDSDTLSLNTAATSGSATVSITPPTNGRHVLKVQARDKAGNYGPVTTHTLLVGDGALSEPRYGTVTAAKLPIAGEARADVTGMTVEYRRADTDTWASLPADHVTLAQGGGAVTWPVARVSGVFPRLTWDVAATLSGDNLFGDPVDGPLQVRVVFTGGTTSTGNSGEPIKLTFDREKASAATAAVGPGSVNLLTGNLTLSDSDVSVDAWGSDLTVSRTYNTREHDAAPNGPFGPGWVLAGGVDELDTDYTTLKVTGSVVQIGTADGDTLGFAKKATTSGGATYTPELGLEDLTLTYTTSGDTYTLKDLDGTVVTFTKITGATAYSPATVTNPSTGATTWTWERKTFGSGATATEVIRPTRMVAPAPAGVSCTAAPLTTRGCRSLTFTYTPGTAAPPAAGQFGDHPDRLQSVALTAWDPDLATPAMRTVTLARYDYTSGGRLHGVWDPRLDHGAGLHLADTYGYDGDGVLNAVTPAAEEPWTLAYTVLPSDNGLGRLKTATRSALSAGTATSTVVYAVPVSGTGAPYDLSAAQTQRWGQAEAPVDATAVFGPDQVPSSPPSSYERADITYLDANAQEVNEAAPGGRITATGYNLHGSVTRTLSAANRARALNASTTDTAADEAALAERLDTQNTYDTSTVEVTERQRLIETLGPEHDTALPDGSVARARGHTVYTYDQGAPTTGGPFDLVTTIVTGARVAGASTDTDTRTTTTAYDWDLRQPTSVAVDPAGLNLVTTTTYNSDGLVTSTTTPAGAGSTTTPSTRKMTYWTAGAHPTVAECGNRPEYAQLVCRVDPGGQAATGPELPVTKSEKYDLFHQPRQTIEKLAAGTVLRTTTTDYDSAARPVLVTVTGGAATGVAPPRTRTVYEPATGRATKTQSLDAGGAVTAEIVRGYDALGRQTSYTDADGVTSTTTYDLLSRPATTNDGKGTQTLTYDTGTERRGLLTRVVDSQAGTFDATYDDDGTPATQTLPNGARAFTTTDETGTSVGLTYDQPCTTDPSGHCPLLDDQVVETIHGQWAVRGGNDSEQNYTYDKTGRLTRVIDNAAGTCTTRDYAFAGTPGKASNRTGLTTYTAAAPTSTPCPAPASGATADSTRTWTYDTADRVTTTGYTYDVLGRTTTVPAADTANPTAGNLTATYHVSDLVRSITHNGRTTTYDLDVHQERIRTWTDANGGVTTTRKHHYDSDGDNPSWTDESAGNTTRAVNGIGGGLTALTETTGTTTTTTFQLADVHGDIALTTAADLTAQPGPLTTSRYTEYGQPADPDTTSRTGTRRYGWLGAHQRAQDTPGGITLMGVRLYNPSLGRFLSVDPVDGGSCNAYEYACGDPVNNVDLDGKAWWKRKKNWKRAWGFVKVGLGAAALFGCAVCGLILAADAAFSMARAVKRRRWADAGWAAADVATFGYGRRIRYGSRAAQKARKMWLKKSKRATSKKRKARYRRRADAAGRRAGYYSRAKRRLGYGEYTLWARSTVYDAREW